MWSLNSGPGCLDKTRSQKRGWCSLVCVLVLWGLVCPMALHLESVFESLEPLYSASLHAGSPSLPILTTMNVCLSILWVKSQRTHSLLQMLFLGLLLQQVALSCTYLILLGVQMERILYRVPEDLCLNYIPILLAT